MMIEKGHVMKTGRHVIQALLLLSLWLGGALALQAQTRTVHSYYTDPQGTVLAKTDAQGNIIAQYDYTPYGDTVASLGNLPDGPGYTGHVNDPETGLVYMQARYYHPMGRYLSPDPVGPIAGNIYSFNRYAYADNNPIVHDDPTGMFPDRNDGDPDDMGPDGECDAVCRFENYGSADRYESPESSGSKSDDQTGRQHVSRDGINFIKGWESWNGVYDKSTGLWLPEDDGFGNKTIGWGHNCGACTDFAGGITKSQGDGLLRKDLSTFEAAVRNIAKGGIDQNHFDALVSFAFNVRSFKSSVLMHNVGSGDPVIEKNFTSYGNARNRQGVLTPTKSLYVRRESEWNMYSVGVYNSTH